MTTPTDGFIALVMSVDLHARVYGPYPTEPAAQEVTTSIGFTDTDVLGARVLPIAHPDDAVTAAWADAAQPAPHHVLAHLTGRLEPDGPALVLLADPAQELLLAVGPFTDEATARAWLDTTPRPAGLEPHLVTLTPGPQPHPDHHGRPHVILTNDAGTITCYGPWPDGLHATAWFHHTGVGDRAGFTATLIEVAPPFDLTGTEPTPIPPTASRGATTIVRVWDAGITAAVGLFPDESAAQSWLDSQAPHLDANMAVVTVTDPGRYRAT